MAAAPFAECPAAPTARGGQAGGDGWERSASILLRARGSS